MHLFQHQLLAWIVTTYLAVLEAPPHSCLHSRSLLKEGIVSVRSTATDIAHDQAISYHLCRYRRLGQGHLEDRADQVHPFDNNLKR